MTQPENTGAARGGRRVALSGDGSAAGEPVAQRVARLLRELQEARTRRAGRNGADPVPRFRTDAAEPPLVRLLPPERSLSEVARSRGAWEEAPASAADPPERNTDRSEDGTGDARRESRAGTTRRAPARRERVARPPSGERPSPPIQPRTDRPEIPEGSRLSAAEIQALIRAGRGVRAVAEIAEAPVDWVRYLAQPVIAEKAAVLSQVLKARPRRPRAKGPGDPLGRALLLALRARKVPAPENVLANGFTAYRRGHEPWRVRLTFRQDGRRLSALWAYDPRTNTIEPRNELADELGWRRVSRGR